MGVEALDGYMFCNTANTHFGPRFDCDEHVEAFIQWVFKTQRQDPRAIAVPALHELKAQWEQETKPEPPPRPSLQELAQNLSDVLDSLQKTHANGSSQSRSNKIDIAKGLAGALLDRLKDQRHGGSGGTY